MKTSAQYSSKIILVFGEAFILTFDSLFIIVCIYSSSSLWTTILTQMMVLLTVVMAQIPGLRQFLIKNPKFFTRGLMSHEGPLAANRAAQRFQMTFRTRGWTERQPLTEEPKQELLTRLSSLDPFYGMTSLSVLAAAKIILKECDKMPNE